MDYVSIAFALAAECAESMSIRRAAVLKPIRE